MSHREQGRRLGQRTLSQADLTHGVTTGQIAPVDRLHRPIRPGCAVLVETQISTIFEVTAVTPVLDPRAPVPMVRVNIAAQFDVVVPLGQPVAHMVIVRDPAPTTDVATPAVGVDNGHDREDHLSIVRPASAESDPERETRTGAAVDETPPIGDRDPEEGGGGAGT